MYLILLLLDFSFCPYLYEYFYEYVICGIASRERIICGIKRDYRDPAILVMHVYLLLLLLFSSYNRRTVVQQQGQNIDK